MKEMGENGGVDVPQRNLPSKTCSPSLNSIDTQKCRLTFDCCFPFKLSTVSMLTLTLHYFKFTAVLTSSRILNGPGRGWFFRKFQLFLLCHAVRLYFIRNLKYEISTVNGEYTASLLLAGTVRVEWPVAYNIGGGGDTRNSPRARCILFPLTYDKYTHSRKVNIAIFMPDTRKN